MSGATSRAPGSPKEEKEREKVEERRKVVGKGGKDKEGKPAVESDEEDWE